MNQTLVTLQDKYMLREGRIYISGLQALVRLPLMQRWLDQDHQINTGGFISGYRGSPLGGYDLQLWQAKKYLAQNHIVFVPGINEDLGATAVWGSQQTTLYPGAQYKGVFGLWYGKGPGVDRSGDVLKHANAAGTAQYGGVLAVAGDDHACKSSTLPHQSDFAFIDANIPILYPADVQDILDFGLYGWALSRYSGCWVGFKAITDNMDASASVWVGPQRTQIQVPTDFEMPNGGLNIRWPDPPSQQEERLHRYKLPAAQAFVRANQLDKVMYAAPKPCYGIVTTGKSYFDTVQALNILGLDKDLLQKYGIIIYKVAMPWPLEPERAKEFCKGLTEVLVVEEKRGLIEPQLKDLLYHLPATDRPTVVGKHDQKGAPLLRSILDLDPTLVAKVLRERLQTVLPKLPLGPTALLSLEATQAPLKERQPFYCSGCPHNTSTKVPEGSRALGGIGCHYMATWIFDGTSTFTQMGGEGVPWIGQAPFTKTPHVFANLGDGTYFHSGSLAIRATIAAGVNITFKILYNDAVAMTGGQPVDGTLTVPQITQQLHAEGVRQITVVSDDPHKYPIGADFAAGTKFFHRDELPRIQKDFRSLPGVSVIIYDQTCAAEKRRRRKRKLMEDPNKRIFINEAVCEGCGDCSKQSNCLSIIPTNTAFGTKRMIEQSTCNKDYSCVKGFCPSFVNVIGGELKQVDVTKSAFPDIQLPDPILPSVFPSYNIYVAGVGGMGIVTVGALLAMAAHIEGKGCSTVDMTGLAQKGGAVVSHVRIAQQPEDIEAKRIGMGETNLLLGCDILVAALPQALQTLKKNLSYALINTQHTVTGDFAQGKPYNFPQAQMQERLEKVVGKERIDFVPATAFAQAIAGDTIATNIFLLGYAFQKGWLPLSLWALEETIRLNGVQIEQNLNTFNWGRLAAYDMRKVEQAVSLGPPEVASPQEQTWEEILAHRMMHLKAYQNQALADKYYDLVQAFCKKDPKRVLTKIIGENYAKILAYKDEYEVARLYSHPAFLEKLKQQFSSYERLEVNLAPPLLSRHDPETGLTEKKTYGPWIFKAFKLLVKFKGLRGTPFDPFGYLKERRQERALIKEYEKIAQEILGTLTEKNYESACEILAFPAAIKGFGHIKEANRIKTMERLKAQIEKYREITKTVA